jgi:hypothetical protein
MPEKRRRLFALTYEGKFGRCTHSTHFSLEKALQERKRLLKADPGIKYELRHMIFCNPGYKIGDVVEEEP